MMSTKATPPKGPMKKFKAPGPGYSFKEFVITELDANQELDAVRAADRKLKTDADRSSIAILMKAQSFELQRAALVRVDGVDVWNRGVEYLELDTWNEKSRDFLAKAVNTLSPRDIDAEKKALDAAEDFVFGNDDKKSSGNGSASPGTLVE
jgi:hypothetical protein